MYVRTKLREPDGLVIPKGPSFSRAQTISCDIDGTTLHFKAPKHQPRRSSHKELTPARRFHMEEMIFRSNYNEDISVSDNWKTFDLFHRSWAFNGPWFTGSLAEMYMYFTLVKPVNYENMDFSLFHPRAFENIVADYLSNEHSKYIDKDNGKHLFIAPVDWQPLSKLPVVAVRLQVVPDETITYSTIDHFVFFPIAEQVMACIHFIPSQLRPLPQEELDKLVSRSTMYELMDNIIDSIQLTLSPEALARQKAALAGLDDTSLVKEFLPLKWDNVKQDSGFKKIEN